MRPVKINDHNIIIETKLMTYQDQCNVMLRDILTIPDLEFSKNLSQSHLIDEP